MDIPKTGSSSLNLVVSNSVFPNLTISRDWYGVGESKFFQLEFRSCDFDHIAEGAFDHYPFELLYSLVFKSNIRPLDCKSGILNGLNLVSLEFFSSPIERMDYDFLWPIQSRLSYVTVRASLENAESFIHFLGGIGLPYVRQVTIQLSSALSIIRFRNLFGIQNVTSMELSSCGLEAIEERAFDHVSKTLTLLNLDNNKLTTLPNTIYDELLKSKSIASVFMERNPWECDCHLSMLINKIESNDGFHMSVYTKFPEDCDLFLQKEDNNCFRLPNITFYEPSMSCMSLYGTNFLNIKYPKFNTWTHEPHVDLMIKAKNPKDGNKYYTLQMLVAKNGRSIDVVSKATSNQVRCVIYRGAEANVTVLRKDVIHIVCIMDNVKKNMVWPMNCRSFPFDYRGEPSNLWLRAGDIILLGPVLAVIYLIAIVFGTAGGYMVVVMSPKLLKGHERVVITKNPARGKLMKAGYTVFVMPSDWINPRKNMF